MSDDLTIPFTVVNRKQTQINQILTFINTKDLGDILRCAFVWCEESEVYYFFAERAGHFDAGADNSINSLQSHGFRVIRKICFAGIVRSTAPLRRPTGQAG